MIIWKRFTIIFFIPAILFLKSCVSLDPSDPSEPNQPYIGSYPLNFDIIKKKNPLLAIEFGKLPEIQDGFSKAEIVAMDKIIDIYIHDTLNFEKAFKRMYKVGNSKIRKYCTPLQASFWLFQDGKLRSNSNPFQNYKLKSLLDLAWSDLYSPIDTERWNDFQTVVDRLNSPELLDYYERRVIRYKYLSGYGEGPEEALRVFNNKYGHCAQITAFTVFVLRKAGYNAHRHIINRPELMSPKGNSHRACMFIVNGNKYIMDNGRWPPFGIIRIDDYDPMVYPSHYDYYKLWEELS